MFSTVLNHRTSPSGHNHLPQNRESTSTVKPWGAERKKRRRRRKRRGGRRGEEEEEEKEEKEEKEEEVEEGKKNRNRKRSTRMKIKRRK